MVASLVLVFLTFDGFPRSESIKIHKVNSKGIIEQYVSDENLTQDTQRNRSDDLESSLTSSPELVHEQAYGLTWEHYLKLQDWADEHDEIIVLRRTESLSLNRIKAKYPTKSVDVHDKSSDWGPHAGYVPIDPFFAKVKAGYYPTMGPADTDIGFQKAFDKKIEHAEVEDSKRHSKYRTGIQKVQLHIKDIIPDPPISGSEQLDALQRGPWIVHFQSDAQGAVEYQLRAASTPDQWRVLDEVNVYEDEKSAKDEAGKSEVLAPRVVRGNRVGNLFYLHGGGVFKISKRARVEPFVKATQLPYYPLYVWAYNLGDDQKKELLPVTGDYDLWQIAPHVGGEYCRYNTEKVKEVDEISTQRVIGGMAAQSAFLHTRLDQLNRHLADTVPDQQSQVFNHGPEMYNFKFLQELDDMLTFIVPRTARASRVKTIVPGGPVIVPYLGEIKARYPGGVVKPDRDSYTMLSTEAKRDLVNKFKADWELRKENASFVLPKAQELANTVLEFQKQGYIFHTNAWYGASFVEFGGKLMVQKGDSNPSSDSSGAESIASPKPQTGLKYRQVKAFWNVLNTAYQNLRSCGSKSEELAIQYHSAWVPVYIMQAEKKVDKRLRAETLLPVTPEVLPQHERQGKQNLEAARDAFCNDLDKGYGDLYKLWRDMYVSYWNDFFKEKQEDMTKLENMPTGGGSQGGNQKEDAIKRYLRTHNRQFTRYIGDQAEKMRKKINHGVHGGLRFNYEANRFFCADWYTFVWRMMLP